MGVPVARVALRRAREGAGAASVAAEVWRRMPRHVRDVLIAFCTDRQAAKAWEDVSWRAFSDVERDRIGATARAWKHALEGAGLLR
jgi:hypothetical protein